MGYYTQFSLNVEGSKETREFHEKEIGDLYYDGFNPFQESTKWYDSHDDMVDYSKKHPDVLFTLDGEGEESGDIWRRYYKNGKWQDANTKVVYDDFDETKLK